MNRNDFGDYLVLAAVVAIVATAAFYGFCIASGSL
jgi:hypothetical protein